MSYPGDDDIERFLTEAFDREQGFAEVEQEDVLRRLALIESLGKYGIEATFTDPVGADDHGSLPYSLTIVDTPDGLEEFNYDVESAWVYFTEQLSSAKGLSEYGTVDGLDPWAIEATTEALATVITHGSISLTDKQAAVNVAADFLGRELVDVVLQKWGFNPDQEVISDPRFADKIELVKMSMEANEDQEIHNLEVRRTLRPLLEANLLEFMPTAHDDFSVLVDSITVAVMLQLSPKFDQIIEKEGSQLEAVRSTILDILHNVTERHGLDSYKLADLAIAMAGAYKSLGYRSTDS